MVTFRWGVCSALICRTLVHAIPFPTGHLLRRAAPQVEHGGEAERQRGGREHAAPAAPRQRRLPPRRAHRSHGRLGRRQGEEALPSVLSLFVFGGCSRVAGCGRLEGSYRITSRSASMFVASCVPCSPTDTPCRPP